MNFNNLVIWDKIIICILAAMLSVAAFLCLSFLYHKHWHNDIRPFFVGPIVSNPDDPNFDPMKFRFQHYRAKRGNEWELPAALLKMFPPGTDKRYIDEILVGQAGTESQAVKSRPGRYGYHWPSFASIGGHAILIDFDENGKSETIFLGSNRLYESRSYQLSRSEAMRAYEDERVKTNAEDDLERRMRPIRKKYLKNEHGFID